jgi:hypothetical protein
MIGGKLIARLAPVFALTAATLGLAACNGGLEREGERVDRGVKEDVRGVRDFLGSRGITIDTRLPDR